MIRDLHPHTRPQRTLDPQAVSSEARELGYEPRDWPAERVLAAVPALFVMLGATLGGMAFAVARLSADRPTAPASAVAEVSGSAPGIEAAPEAHRKRIEEQQLDRLKRAPVPIERAMDEVVRRGWRDEGRGR